MHLVSLIPPESFDADRHFYPRVRNAHMHPLVRFFMNLGNERIAERYCHLHPAVDPVAVREVLARTPRHFRWGGADLFHTTDDQGFRRMVVIETNSSPSGQKSMPLFADEDELGGYRRLLECSFLPLLKRRALPEGGLAVLYDKNEMETGGYAAALAELTGESVYLVPFFEDDADPPARFEEGVLQIRHEGDWLPIRAAFRYVTQRPWTRIPALVRTAMLNPVLACLAGGRNKLLAAKAYDLYNAELLESGLSITSPETIWDVALREVPLWIQRMGGYGVVKNPYSNAGQGVWTITCQEELDHFLSLDHPYDRFIVQALVGNAGWSSWSRAGRLYHVGTVPDRRNNLYVADLRCMVAASPEGFLPVALYARRGREPLSKEPPEGGHSWDMLGTNLSVRHADGSWTTESDRLLLMDSRDFNKLGMGLDDFIDAYLQTVMSMHAIDRMAQLLVNSKGRFRRKYFASLNPDDALVRELM